MTTLLYLIACLMSPAPRINLAEGSILKEILDRSAHGQMPFEVPIPILKKGRDMPFLEVSSTLHL